MLRDIDISDAAEVLLASYGEAARAEAWLRSRASKSRGDDLSAANWDRVAALIFWLQCGTGKHSDRPH